MVFDDQVVATVTMIVENTIISGELYQSRLAVEKGKGLTEPLRKSEWVPKNAGFRWLQGEETGNFRKHFRVIYQVYYDK